MEQKEQIATYAERQRADGKFPAVFRLESVHPDDVAGIIGHAERRIGNVDHVDKSRSHLNRILIGSNAIAREIRAEADAMSEHNFVSNLEGLKRAGRRKEHFEALAAGKQDPFDRQKKGRGPLREFVLTLHRDFFLAGEDCPSEFRLEFLDDTGTSVAFDLRKAREFVNSSMAFLKNEFGDMLRYARVDLDEQSVHIQGLLVGYKEHEPSVRFAHGRKRFQTSQHRLIGGEPIMKMVDGEVKKLGHRKGYELAQDAVGEWFAQDRYKHLNIVRGEARAMAARGAHESAVQFFQEEDLALKMMGHGGLKIPAGAKNARRMWLLKEQAKQRSRSGNLRKDNAQNLALDYLVELGVLTSVERHESSSRRARTELLKRYESDYGTADEIISDPGSAALKRLSKTRRQVDELNKKSKERIEEEREKQRQSWESERADFEKKRDADLLKLVQERSRLHADQLELAQERREFEAEYQKGRDQAAQLVDTAYDLAESIRGVAEAVGYFKSNPGGREKFRVLERVRGPRVRG
ncbi:hypothetical protein [Acidimangrovimonas pyrenivorans]|uniref:Uncharacterized protein n=1 Tax=Acidimangrovimonas pyrenivorans TaxID=2030798 RepID=A0ABV7ADF0_9RHOB